MNRRYQVVIVGGGPVGVALAVELGQRGISCALVERRTEPQRIPKGQNLTQRSMEHFYSWGVADEVRAARMLPPDYPMSGIVAYRDLNNEYWYAPPLREIVNSYYFQDNERLPQYLVEYVLRQRMAQLATSKPRFGWAAETIEQDASSARVTVAEEGGAERVNVSKPTTWSAATAAIPPCAGRSASSAAARISTSSWCWRCSARASCMKSSSAFRRAPPIACCIRT